MEERKELNKDERTEAIINIAEGFTQCDTYQKGYIAGFIQAAKEVCGRKSDTKASTPTT